MPERATPLWKLIRPAPIHSHSLNRFNANNLDRGIICPVALTGPLNQSLGGFLQIPCCGYIVRHLRSSNRPM